MCYAQMISNDFKFHRGWTSSPGAANYQYKTLTFSPCQLYPQRDQPNSGSFKETIVNKSMHAVFIHSDVLLNKSVV